ncbi:MAG: hypothetical protein V9G15_06640 [Dermatophilaceae bacterium]|nr:hypothetical protein [Actinomycetales bacterium]
MTERLSDKVAGIHPDLAWHFGQGSSAQHCLTVSAGGVAELRPVAERWLRSAPAPDATWEFRSSQAADPGALEHSLEIAGAAVDLSQTRFAVDVAPDERRVHVGVYHPAYRQVPLEVRGQVTFLVLDWLLGEDDVERWLGHIESLTEAPANPADGAELRASVAQLARQRDPDAWGVAEFRDQEGMPGLATFRTGVRWIDHPTLDRHQLVTLTYAAQGNGLPADDAALAGLRAVEEELEGVLGSRGLVIGHESHRGVRRVHAYSDGEDQNLDAALAAWAARRWVSIEAEPDPSWRAVRHLTG